MVKSYLLYHSEDLSCLYMKAVLVQRQISAASSIVSLVLNIFIRLTKEMSFLVVVSWAEINILPNIFLSPSLRQGGCTENSWQCPRSRCFLNPWGMIRHAWPCGSSAVWSESDSYTNPALNCRSVISETVQNVFPVSPSLNTEAWLSVRLFERKKRVISSLRAPAFCAVSWDFFPPDLQHSWIDFFIISSPLYTLFVFLLSWESLM